MDTETIIKKIDAFRKLERNCDSYAALPADEDSIEHAKRIARELADLGGFADLSVGLGPDGHVGFSWDWDNGNRSLDVEVMPCGHMLCVYQDGDGKWHKSYTRDVRDVARVVLS